MRIDPMDTCALMIDYQERLMPAIAAQETIIHNTAIFLQGLAQLDIPLIVSEQYPKGLGPTVPALLAHLSNNQPFAKSCFSCCDDEAIMAQLESTGKKTIFVFGVESHICVLQTIIDLQAAGYQAVLITDCSGSRQPSSHKIALKRATAEGALLATYESALFELLRSAKHPSFKAISNLIK